MSRWAIPEFSKKQVNEAGRIILDPNSGLLRRIDALNVVNNWRSIHGHPLNTFQTTLRTKGRRVDPDVIVAQRIKRLSSIGQKLLRFNTMTLSQMQDIGGCRAIVSDVDAVISLVDSYLESDIKHRLHTHRDYMASPQSTGYRGVHLIYQYYSDRTATYNGLKIEMQFRSQYQHAWATAVEIVGTFTKQALKSSQGEGEWLRFFSLMGSALAYREGTAPVPHTPANKADLVAELNILSTSLDAVKRLKNYGTAPTILDDSLLANDHFFLLDLDVKENTLAVTGYKSKDLARAADDYLKVEQQFTGEHPGDAVLVSVESLSSLRRAYPNYFFDTNLFVELLEDALSANNDSNL